MTNDSKNEINLELLSYFEKPFRYDAGYIVDSQHRPILELKGWNHLMCNFMLTPLKGDEIRKVFGEFIVEQLNK